MLIVVEGMDASGKATQVKLLAEKLGGVVIDFPHYSTTVGKLILSHLKEGWRVAREGVKDTTLDDYTYYPQDDNALVLQALMTVNRLEMVPIINEHRASGKPVILDRYFASGMVYGAVDGLDRKWLEMIHATLPQPDVWLFLDITAEESVRRRPDRRDRYEKQPGLMAKVRSGYLQLFTEKGAFNSPPSHWCVIDGIGEVEAVHKRIVSAVESVTRASLEQLQSAFAHAEHR
jgi:dTMP kinase